MTKTSIMTVQGIDIALTTINDEDFICITDIVKAKAGDNRAADVIKNWIRNRTTIEFLGTWEILYNPDFKVVEFDHFRKEASSQHPRHERYHQSELFKTFSIESGNVVWGWIGT